MCRPVACKTCGKTTWTGCGLHVGQLRARIPADQWCAGHPVSEAAGPTAPRIGLVRRVLGHRTTSGGKNA